MVYAYFDETTLKWSKPYDTNDVLNYIVNYLNSKDNTFISNLISTLNG